MLPLLASVSALIGLRAPNPTTFRAPVAAACSAPFEALPPLGDCEVLLSGEAAAVKRGKTAIVRKPDASVRCFALYGVADSSTSLRKFRSAAPPWLEVRLMELPGHGYLADEPLPPCALQRTQPVTAADLQHQRAIWVSQMATDISAVVAESPDVPYALYGFSFGALLVYEVCRELTRQGIQAPLALVVSGRGAPHAVTFSTERMAEVQCYTDERVLEYFAEAFGVNSARIAPSVRPRAASLFRCGALLGAVHVGDAYDTNGAHDLWDDASAPIAHASGVPVVDCPVLSLSGSRDECWPPRLVARWRDVAATADGYREYELEGVEHQALMKSPDAMQIVFDELATLATERASSSPPLSASLPTAAVISTRRGTRASRVRMRSGPPRACVPPDPPLPLTELVARIEQLGRECPWTAEQTPRDVIAFLRDECAEVEEALYDGDGDRNAQREAQLTSELGDVIFNALLLVEVCKRGRTAEQVSIEAAAAASLAKLRRRYPPLFDGSLEGLSAEEAGRVWTAGKSAESHAEDGLDEEDAALAAEIAALDREEEMAERERLAKLVMEEIAREQQGGPQGSVEN